jgi:predicted HicB family RNase H-like nuclease
MKDIVFYKDYIGSIHYSTEDEIFFGKIEGIDDLVSFEGDNVKGIKKAFEEAVDDYIDLCKKEKRNPKKSYKGSFNVRINPELHKKAVHSAEKEGISLNQFVQKAIEDEVKILSDHK